jgi:tRNA-specific 2-thiouridylase
MDTILRENHHPNCSGDRVLLGMSGGVDSAAAALLLMRAGYRVTALTLQTVSNGDGRRAADVARALAIEHIKIDAVDDFHRDVIVPFVESWRSGETPNPCVLCNRDFKFRRLAEAADRLGCDYIATGHYARLVGELPYRYLLRAKDRKRDQSYFLYRLPRAILDRTLLPLGNYTKDQVREIVSSFDVDLGQKADSQDICFLGAMKLSQFLSEQGLEDIPGDFVDTRGAVLGEHRGSWHYSEGQRRGLGISLGERMTVLHKDSANNIVVLGDEEEAMIDSLELRDVASIDQLPSTFDASVQLRSQGQPFPAHVVLEVDGSASVRFESPVRLTSIGQSVVFYLENRVLGGGIVRRMR